MDTEEPPLSPNAAGLGCGLMAGASLMSMVFLGQGFLVPLLSDLFGLNLAGTRWIVTSVLIGVVVAIALGSAFARALKQPRL